MDFFNVLANSVDTLLPIAIIVLLIAQIYVLHKIRIILKRMGRAVDTMAYIFKKQFYQQKNTPEDPFTGIPKNCQFCKHRLAYIHADGSDNSLETLRYRCNLSKQPVAPNASCSRFELDTTLFE